MSYRITIDKKAFKALDDIDDPYRSNIKNAISSLSTDPRPKGCKKLKNRNGYRIRVASYRIVYDIFDNILHIHVINLGHRKDIYK